MTTSRLNHANVTGWRHPGIFGAIVAATLVILAPSAVAKEKPTDSQINAAIEGDLSYDVSVPFNDIDVSTTIGIVTLSGSAPNLLAKERATAIAETVLGVRSVVNEITVNPVERSDIGIRTDIDSALRADPASEAYEITAKVKDGTVTLNGTVQSWHEKRLAADVTKGVRGVREIKNDIRVVYRGDRSDGEIAEDVASSLRRDVWVDDLFIRPTVEDGVVSLTGTVGSAAEKTRARSDCWVAGVKSVDVGNLNVEPWARDRMQKKPDSKSLSDEEIKVAVVDAMLFDPRVFSFRPDVTVSNGIVTLTGVVDNVKAKRAAEEDAKNTSGVWLVRNYLKVRNGTPPSDETLEREVGAAIARDPYLDRFEIEVTSSNGAIHLDGTVDSYYEMLHADDVASRVQGVTSVNNNIEVLQPTYGHYYWPYSWSFYEPPIIRQDDETSGPATAMSDAQLKAEIEDELFWSPFIDSDKITVSVQDGVATLTGTVDSWSEYQGVTENALEGGAEKVINNVTVS